MPVGLKAFSYSHHGPVTFSFDMQWDGVMQQVWHEGQVCHKQLYNALCMVLTTHLSSSSAGPTLHKHHCHSKLADACTLQALGRMFADRSCF